MSNEPDTETIGMAFVALILSLAAFLFALPWVQVPTAAGIFLLVWFFVFAYGVIKR